MPSLNLTLFNIRFFGETALTPAKYISFNMDLDLSKDFVSVDIFLRVNLTMFNRLDLKKTGLLKRRKVIVNTHNKTRC